MIKHLNIVIKGKVQGVYYRASAKEAADRMGVTRFVENQKEGSVYIEAEGTDEQLEAFMKWCRIGPDRAVVTTVDITESNLADFKSFEVRKKSIFGF
ncbi:acylphosphatase [Solitalea canadensis]|uniref:acylphosphatase n=1 Tax=Solitalea canadensis (strain ATCC 29591 / DSM 3403 / JCM 21819 / LMG 8368 / NBRC 15130 / NCIMB 12057 / USAM 9D) TaxID=929556 RepID=H8KMS5_SOLCM|nr:acylphosphatase [Solitalea canadensis]AFD09328.1 acylphosphatase [Solitalea canadensis DSM 3403]